MEARGSNLDLSSSPAFYPKPHLVSKWKVPKKEQYYQLYFQGGSRKEKAALHTVLENFKKESYVPYFYLICTLYNKSYFSYFVTPLS